MRHRGGGLSDGISVRTCAVLLLSASLGLISMQFMSGPAAASAVVAEPAAAGGAGAAPRANAEQLERANARLRAQLQEMRPQASALVEKLADATAEADRQSAAAADASAALQRELAAAERERAQTAARLGAAREEARSASAELAALGDAGAGAMPPGQPADEPAAAEPAVVAAAEPVVVAAEPAAAAEPAVVAAAEPAAAEPAAAVPAASAVAGQPNPVRMPGAAAAADTSVDLWGERSCGSWATNSKKGCQTADVYMQNCAKTCSQKWLMGYKPAARELATRLPNWFIVNPDQDMRCGEAIPFVNLKHKVVVCTAPKSASTSWREVLVAMHKDEAAEHADVKPLDFCPQKILRLSDLVAKPVRAQEIMADPSFFKLAFVRNPITRILSGYLMWYPNEKFPGWLDKAIFTYKNQCPPLNENWSDLAQHFYPQHCRCGFQEGVKWDYVGKLEALGETFREIRRRGDTIPRKFINLKDWGMTEDLRRVDKKKSHKRQGHETGAESKLCKHFTLPLFDRLAEARRDEIDFFGYTEDVKKMRADLVKCKGGDGDASGAAPAAATTTTPIATDAPAEAADAAAGAGAAAEAAPPPPESDEPRVSGNQLPSTARVPDAAGAAAPKTAADKKTQRFLKQDEGYALYHVNGPHKLARTEPARSVIKRGGCPFPASLALSAFCPDKPLDPLPADKLSRYVMEINLAGQNGIGFWSQVIYMLNQLIMARKQAFIPFVWIGRLSWDTGTEHDERNPYVAPDVGPNLWTYFFQPTSDYDPAKPDGASCCHTVTKNGQLCLAKGCINGEDSVLAYYYGHGKVTPIQPHAQEQDIDRDYSGKWYKTHRMQAHKTLKQYVRFQPKVAAQLEAWRKKLFVPGKKVLGVHIRGTDKVWGGGTVMPDEYAPFIKKYLAKHPGAIIFVATDSPRFLKAMKANSEYGHLIRHYDAGAHRTDNWAAMDALKGKSEAVFMDAMLLAMCDFLLLTSSSVAEAAIYFNPALHENSLLLQFKCGHQGSWMVGQDGCMAADETPTAAWNGRYEGCSEEQVLALQKRGGVTRYSCTAIDPRAFFDAEHHDNARKGIKLGHAKDDRHVYD